MVVVPPRACASYGIARPERRARVVDLVVAHQQHAVPRPVERAHAVVPAGQRGAVGEDRPASRCRGTTGSGSPSAGAGGPCRRARRGSGPGRPAIGRLVGVGGHRHQAGERPADGGSGGGLERACGVRLTWRASRVRCLGLLNLNPIRRGAIPSVGDLPDLVERPRLGQPPVVAERVAERRVDPVEALLRLLDELDSLGLQLLVRRVAVVGGQRTDARGSRGPGGCASPRRSAPRPWATRAPISISGSLGVAGCVHGEPADGRRAPGPCRARSRASRRRTPSPRRGRAR